MSSSCSSQSSDNNNNSTMETRKKFKSDFNIRALLEKSHIGQSIIAEISTACLTRKSRLQFVRMVVAEIINQFGDRPSCEVKMRMARAIIDAFPSLKDDEGQGFEAWYTPGKGRHSATGWIEERLRNVRRSYVKPISSTSTSSSSSSLISATLPESDLSDDQYASMVVWLKHNIEPVSQVHSFMAKTAIGRAKWLRGNPGGHLKEFPRLFDTPGMVELDFRAIFPDVSDKLCMLWTPTYAGEVLKYANLQGGKWQTYLNVNASTLTSDDKKVNIALGLLPSILPPGRKAKKRASVDESLASYIDVQPIGTNMPKYLEEVRNTQPYVLILGAISEPLQCFTIIERKAIPQVSFMKAIDVCFKLFYILNLDYPWECYTTWEFFQKVVFGLEDTGNRTKTSPAVISMRTALKKAAK